MSKRKEQNQPVPMDVDPNEDEISEDEEGGRRVMGIYIPPPIKPHCSMESTGNRLLITKMVCFDFKSYAEKISIGPFHHRFSAIIGPNGSGKSNVIDAMLFVFGYRAQKIRSKKISVLIHNSNARHDLNQCKVEVHFVKIQDKPDGTYEKIPNSEFTIARIGFSDNSSNYQIDGKVSTFKEVTRLLKEFGIDLDHNRFLILQGEVESIAMMKPKAINKNECGLLEYLEDIIGTSRYLKPLEQINESIEDLNAKRTDKHNRCKMAEREMKDLEKPMTEAIEFLKAENAHARAINLQIQKYLRETKLQIDQAEVTQGEITTELDGHDKEFEGIINERKEKQKIIEENAKIKEDCLKRKDGMETALKAVQRKYNETQEAMVATNKRRKQLMAQLKKEEEKLEELKKVPEKNQREIDESEEKIKRLTKQLQDLESELEKNLAAFKEETRELQQKKEKLQTKITDLRAKSDSDKAALDLKESELKIVTSERTSELRKLNTYKDSLAEFTTTLQEKKDRLINVKQEETESKSELERLTKAHSTNKHEQQVLTDKIRSLDQKIDESSTELQGKYTHTKVLDFLMNQKKSGRIPGIIGRLGDLGGIDAKYDVAISNSCPKLDNILVDNADTAQTCIEALRKHNVGQGTFIALDKMDKHIAATKQKINTPENVPRLFDLLHVEDERVLPAFYFALRDTLVGENLEQATRIAYGKVRYRVVTLQGAVIDLSGIMTGGGGTVSRGKMGQQVQTKSKGRPSISMKDLDVMKNERMQYQNQINCLQQEQGEMEREIRNLQKKFKQLEYESQKLDSDIKMLIKQIPTVESHVQHQQEIVDNTHSDEAAVKKLEIEIADLKKIYGGSSKVTGEIQTEIDGITQQVDDIQKKKIKTVRDKINDLKKQIDKLVSNVNKLRVEIGSSERNVQKTEEKIESTKEDKATAEASIKKHDEIRKECTTDQEKIEQKLSEIIEELAKVDDGFGDIKKEIASLQKKENEGKMKRLEIEQKLDAINEQIRDMKKTIPRWEAKLKPLKLNPIPNEPEPEPFKQYTEDELDSHTTGDIQYQVSAQEEKLVNKPNLSVIERFQQRREIYNERVRDLEDITAQRNEMRQTFDEVRKMRFTEFNQGFSIITTKLKEMYQMITLGGDAELELVDSMDPFSEGVVFSVRPPKKSWKQISNLSGGEKTLSSLALVFALHYYKPSPLYVMDEIDAALDFKNVSIVANYIKQRTKNAQFIIISLRSNMFELSDYLVGICKTKDKSQSITIKNEPPRAQTPIGMSYPMSTQVTQVPQATQQSQAATHNASKNQTFDNLKNDGLSQPPQQTHDQTQSQVQEQPVNQEPEVSKDQSVEIPMETAQSENQHDMSPEVITDDMLE